MTAKKLSIGVLASGRGSNLQAIIDAIDDGSLAVRIALVASDVRDAYALQRAADRGIPTLFIDPREQRGREAFDLAVVGALQAARVDLVVLAGYMRILSPAFIRAFPRRIMNIHPALLPAFPGLHVQRKAIEYGVRFAGCTVHFVDEGVDTGPVIVQAVVPVLEGDNEESLSARILACEHRIYPEAIRLFAADRLTIEGRLVRVKRAVPRPNDCLVNPPLDS